MNENRIHILLSRASRPIVYFRDLLLHRYSSHGVQYTPLQAESVNVKIVKYGLDSAS